MQGIPFLCAFLLTSAGRLRVKCLSGRDVLSEKKPFCSSVPCSSCWAALCRWRAIGWPGRCWAAGRTSLLPPHPAPSRPPRRPLLPPTRATQTSFSSRTVPPAKCSRCRSGTISSGQRRLRCRSRGRTRPSKPRSSQPTATPSTAATTPLRPTAAGSPPTRRGGRAI